MSVCSADPWQVKNNSSTQPKNGNSELIEKFEDNFLPAKKAEKPTEISNKSDKSIEPLPDSANYLQLLERKLEKVQKGAKLLESLSEKKQDCMRSLLESSGTQESTLEQLLELDTPIESGRLHRHLLPVQAVSVGEILHIVKHDALEQHIEEEQLEQEEKGTN